MKRSDIQNHEDGIEKNIRLSPKQERDRKAAWDKKRADIDTIADRLGRGIDEKIKNAVTAFNVHEFPTSASCEGHVHDGKTEEEPGELPYPWVEVYAPEPKDFTDEEKKKEVWTIENLKHQQKMTALLAEFYKERKTPFDARLTFRNIGAFGGFRVQSFGADTMELLTPQQQREKLELYRKEMDDFTGFLKERFLTQE